MTGPTGTPFQRLAAETALLGAVILWASTAPIQRWLIGEGQGNELSVHFVMSSRYVIAALGVLLLKPRAVFAGGLAADWLASMWLGLLNWAAILPGLKAIETIDAGRSVFLASGLGILIVPLLQAFWLGRPPSKTALRGVFLAMVGLALFTNAFRLGLSPGDLWAMSGAIGSSLYLIDVARLAPRTPLPRLLFGQFCFAGVAGTAWAIAEGSGPIELSAPVTMTLLQLGLLGTLLPTLLHNRFLPRTTPTRALPIFVLTPVLVAVMGWAFLGEVLTANQVVGGFVIIGGILLNEVATMRDHTQFSTDNEK